jgi:hypothetical protein
VGDDDEGNVRVIKVIWGWWAMLNELMGDIMRIKI